MLARMKAAPWETSEDFRHTLSLQMHKVEITLLLKYSAIVDDQECSKP